IPVADRLPDRPGAAAFGVVGIFLAVVAAVPFVVLASSTDEPVLAAIAAIATLAVLSGAMHLDGLADTADALLARDPESAERARKDPAVGPGGLLAIVLVVSAEIAALSSLAASTLPIETAWVLVAAAGVSRVLPIVLVWATPDPRTANGLGSWFTERLRPLDVALAVASGVAIVALLAFATRPALALDVIVGSAIGVLAGWFLAVRRSGLDGDVLGASIELGFASILATTAVLVR
ncbi:MAG TPA: adenosylcobinamide-GDP ribazoletransferase, partial [Solirubrobacterales bacterium]|nr:adenosylcobinamide-GDP ribazoletransferase [Solirubrobacterales bacterium]